MKKALLLILSGLAGLMLGQSALATVVVTNSTDQKIFLYTDHGKKFDRLLPGESRDCSFYHCNKFNVLVKNSFGKKVTVCTITPVMDGGTVRVTHILNNKVNGGCYSYYQYQ